MSNYTLHQLRQGVYQVISPYENVIAVLRVRDEEHIEHLVMRYDFEGTSIDVAEVFNVVCPDDLMACAMSVVADYDRQMEEDRRQQEDEIAAEMAIERHYENVGYDTDGIWR